MPLPTVLVTDTIRSASEGESHGGAYLVDLEKGASRQVLDWNRRDIRWEGRGDGRGLRGIAFYRNEVYIAASDEIFVFDQNFRLRRSFKNPYLGHAHEVFLDGHTLYVVSTRFDSILAIDLRSWKFTKGWMYRLFVRMTEAGPSDEPPQPRWTVYNPASDKGPPPSDTAHLNSVWVQGGRVFFSGVRIRQVLAFDESGEAHEFALLPDWTHNARPHLGGVLCNSTSRDAIIHFDLAGKALREFPVPRYDPAMLKNVPVSEDVARQAFGRGLATTGDGVVVGGSSPSTVTAYDWESGRVLKSVNLTMDVRNAVHGLAIWPWGS